MGCGMTDSTPIDLLFGRGHLPVRAPEAAQVHVIRKAPLRILPDPARAVRDALDHPIG